MRDEEVKSGRRAAYLLWQKLCLLLSLLPTGWEEKVKKTFRPVRLQWHTVEACGKRVNSLFYVVPGYFPSWFPSFLWVSQGFLSGEGGWAHLTAHTRGTSGDESRQQRWSTLFVYSTLSGRRIHWLKLRPVDKYCERDKTWVCAAKEKLISSGEQKIERGKEKRQMDGKTKRRGKKKPLTWATHYTERRSSGN